MLATHLFSRLQSSPRRRPVGQPNVDRVGTPKNIRNHIQSNCHHAVIMDLGINRIPGIGNRTRKCFSCSLLIAHCRIDGQVPSTLPGCPVPHAGVIQPKVDATTVRICPTRIDIASFDALQPRTQCSLSC